MARTVTIIAEIDDDLDVMDYDSDETGAGLSWSDGHGLNCGIKILSVFDGMPR